MRKTAGRFGWRSSVEATGNPAMAMPAFMQRGEARAPPPRRRLAAQTKPRDERLVTPIVARLDVVEQAAALRDELQEAAA